MIAILFVLIFLAMVVEDTYTTIGLFAVAFIILTIGGVNVFA